MINKLKLQYYLLLIKYYDFFKKETEMSFHYSFDKNITKVYENIKADKIKKLSYKYNEIYTKLYSNNITKETLVC